MIIPVVGPSGPAPKGRLPSVGKSLADLIRRYANPSDSRQHAEIAGKIRDAVAAKNRTELCKQLEYFGNARNNERSERMQIVEMYCSREARALIDRIQALDEVPWDEMQMELGMPKATPKAAPPVAGWKPPAPSKEEIERGREFLKSDVVKNSNLTSEARQFLASQIESARNIYSAKDPQIRSISQDGNKITIVHAGGRAFLYMR